MSQDPEQQLEAEIAHMREKVFGKREQSVSEPTVEPTNVDEAPEVISDSQPNHEEADLQLATDDDPSKEVPEKKKYTDWKHRYTTYKSSTDVTINHLRRENITLTESNIFLSKKVDALQKDNSELKASTADDIYKNLFSDEERDIVGEDTISTVRKATKAAVDSAVKPLQEALEEERKQRLQALELSAKESYKSVGEAFLERLEELCPDYTKYDTDPKFHEWMEQPEKYSGVIRSTLFKNAQSIGDARRVSEFFNDYAGEIEDKTKALDANIGPAKSGSSAQVPKPKQQVAITRAFVDKFYEDCIRGQYDGKEKIRQEIESQIKLALAQGRLR